MASRYSAPQTFEVSHPSERVYFPIQVAAIAIVSNHCFDLVAIFFIFGIVFRGKALNISPNAVTEIASLNAVARSGILVSPGEARERRPGAAHLPFGV